MSKFQHDVMLRIVKILNVLMIELPFAACWFLYYSHQTYANLAWEGHFAILGLFFILYIALGKIYDAFWMSMQRVSELVYGQILGAMATDGILYIVICLMSAKFCNLLPGIAAIVGQLVMAAIWASCAHKWYYKTFPPQKTAVVYDVRHGMQAHPFNSDFYHEDYVLWMELLRVCPTAYGDQKVLMHYRQVTGSRSNKKSNAAKERWNTYRKALKLNAVTSAWAFVRYAVKGVVKYYL